MAKKILVVDNDPNVLEVLDARLTSAGFKVLRALSGPAGLSVLRKGRVDLIISDMKMPLMNGMDFFTEARLIDPDVPVLFLTAYGTIAGAVRAVKAGAVDYLEKPFDGRRLVKKLESILRRATAGGKPGADGQAFSMDTRSPVMRDLYRLVRKVAASNVNIMILGESGVGKEYIARGIHRISARRDKPFVVVDCGSTPAGLLESELFGHVKGSFTHAIQDKAGLIEQADSGTLFLDEIGNISAEMQTRLLRFLEDYTIRRIGQVRPTAVDCRIISATNANLIEDIQAGKFRQDLYYRLRVVTLTVPPLRERKEDIPFLARYFVKRFVSQNGLAPVRLPAETIAWLCDYPWPGNIRELKNAIEAGAVVCKDGVLSPDDLRLTGLPELDPQAGPGAGSLSLEEAERRTIIKALEQSGGVQARAARLLGISRRAIHYKIKKYGIQVARTRPGR